MKHTGFSLRTALGLLFVLCIMSSITNAHSSITVSEKFTPQNAQAFLDSLAPSIMHQLNTVGYGIAIVYNNQVFLTKGYGYADLKNKKPVDPKATLFRTASVCKVLLATALLDLRDRGLIDLHKDINAYLRSFKVPARFGKPITAAHLLTHTPGFDDITIGKSSRDEKTAPKLSDFVKTHLPNRILPPGEVMMYSNLGMALAAVLIEDITGKDFAEYMRERLFTPLEMYRASYKIIPAFKQDIYHGYEFSNGQQKEFPFDFINDYPAGQMLTSLDEFTHFMIMQLNNGAYNGKQIIAQSTIAEMQSPQFTHHKNLHGAMGYGFFMDNYEGAKLIYHDGGYPGILTRMMMLPQIGLGIYSVTNSTGSPINAIVTDAFLKHFFTFQKEKDSTQYPLKQLPPYDGNVDKFTGTYTLSRYPHSEITKTGVLLGLTGFDMKIWKNEQDMLMMPDLFGKPRRLIQVEPLLFRSIDDNYYIKFRQDEKGNITHLFTDGTTAFEKTPHLLTQSFQSWLMLGITLFFAFYAMTGLIRFLTAKIRKIKKERSDLYKLSNRLANTYLLYILAMGVAILVIMDPFEVQIGFGYGMPWYLYIIQIIPIVFCLFTVMLGYQIIKAVKNKAVKVYAAAGYTLYFLLSIAAVWFFSVWNLLGYRF